MNVETKLKMLMDDYDREYQGDALDYLLMHLKEVITTVESRDLSIASIEHDFNLLLKVRKLRNEGYNAKLNIFIEGLLKR